MMNRALGLFAAMFLLAAGAASAADEKPAKKVDTRAGNCADAKSQMDYFCNKQNSASDTMVAVGTACNNAKNNVKAACEGVVEADKKYEFKDK